jgi:hypothetical protein
MDQTLAALYGTNQEETDVEKLAAAELAEKLAADDSIDMSAMSDEELEQIAQGVLTHAEEQAEVTEPAEVEAAGEEQAEVGEPTEEDFEKVSEADFLGRVMAHAFVHESREIEKQAGEIGNKMSADDLKAAGKSRTTKQKAHDVIRDVKDSKAVQGTKNVVMRTGELLAGGEKPLLSGAGARRPGNFLKLHPKGSHYRGEQLKSLGVRGAAAVGAAGLGALAYKKMKKQSSAVDTLATMRAEEILEAGSYTAPEIGNEDQYDVLASAVETRAIELLGENGYEISEE